MFAVLLILAALCSVSAFTAQVASTRISRLNMATEFSKSLPFLKKPKNLDGMIVSKAKTIINCN